MFIGTTKKGKKFIKLNPAEKSRKYAQELKSGKITSNGGEVLGKLNKDTQKSFRSGYLQARKDNALAYKSNLKRKRKRKTKVSK